MTGGHLRAESAERLSVMIARVRGIGFSDAIQKPINVCNGGCAPIAMGRVISLLPSSLNRGIIKSEMIYDH